MTNEKKQERQKEYHQANQNEQMKWVVFELIQKNRHLVTEAEVLPVHSITCMNRTSPFNSTRITITLIIKIRGSLVV